MANVNKQDIVAAAEHLGIRKNDSILIHSSLKSLGYVEGGADTVIDGFYEAVSEGTLLFPTLCSRDWEHVYENWSMDAESDVGYITNVFRKRENVYRSNQATHSVAAMGKDAKYFTETHGQTGKRPGIFGDTPFSADSPWEKMYEKNTKILFLGVSTRYCTMRHYAEYVFVNDSLEKIKHLPEYEEMRNALWYYGGPQGIWPHIDNVTLCNELKEQGLVAETTCGNATIYAIESRPFVAACMKVMDEIIEKHFWDIGIYHKETQEWFKKIKELKNTL